ncbi:FecR family protein [Pedobacter sp. MR2016-24]|uniref:FecR family protein n=1 Tax=Pedobacter sp. MR2016-24 TaxID=2994466 RepID=UPI002245F7D6|nr:FecR family protein [Pedobacter sp. MR2016-24]MCX2483332.1 FecR family protein [Pedobacter sp. MR2016-24]
MTANNELLLIMERISNSTATDAEIAQFNVWCDSFKGADPAIQNLGEIKERVLSRVHRNISPKPKVFPLYIKCIAVASIASMVIGIWFFTTSRIRLKAAEFRYANDVAPGKHAATLTLANGKKIYLTDAAAGNLANESGVSISRNAKGEIVYTITENSNAAAGVMNKLETSRGEQTQVRLPDGSTVCLNAASSLKYPVSFVNQKNRKVSLSGEGYFEIAKDKTHPFIVESKGQEIKVLGTHFNINAYSDESSSKTTLLEGSILISTVNNSQTLIPGSEATNDGKNINVQLVDTELAVAWKNNLFLFENEELGSIMRQVERWYNVEVIYSDNIAHERFGGGVSRFNSVAKLLKSLEATGKVHFRIEDRKIYVFK